MSVDYYFKRADGAVLCVTNKPYSLPLKFPGGIVPPGAGPAIFAALADDWGDLPARDVIAKVSRIERFLGGLPAELLSEYDVHGMPEPTDTIRRERERVVGAPPP